MSDRPITYGTFKGMRGYWEWKRGRCHFVKADYTPRKSADGLQIIKDIEPFQNIAIDNGIVGGRRQKRDMMRAHGLTEVGNERPQASPQERENARRQQGPDRAIVDALKKASNGKWL